MATKKATPKKSAEEKGKAKKKAAPAKPAKKKEQPVPEPEPEEVEIEEHEHHEGCGCCEGEDELIEKNSNRSYALRDIWFKSLCQVIDEESMPEENKREMLFLTLSNAMLDMIMDIVPQDLAERVAENIDDFLMITAVNQKYNVDLLQMFKEDFVTKMGDTFEDEDELNNALNEFEDNWWNTARKDLEDQSPNDAIKAMADQYEL